MADRGESVIEDGLQNAEKRQARAKAADKKIQNQLHEQMKKRAKRRNAGPRSDDLSERVVEDAMNTLEIRRSNEHVAKAKRRKQLQALLDQRKKRLEEKNAEGTRQEEEEKDIKAMFDLLDSNKDGLIDKMELTDIIDAMDIQLNVDQLIDELDETGNHRLNLNEFTNWLNGGWQEKMNAQNQQRLAETFELFLDENGVASEALFLENALIFCGKEERAQELWNMCSPKDGVIDLKGFSTMFAATSLQ